MYFLLLCSRFVSQIYIYGDASRSCLVAIITPNDEALVSFAKQAGISFDTAASLYRQSRIEEAVVKDLAAAHESLHLTPAEKIHAVRLVDPFSVENGLLTPTQKLVRPKVKELHWNLIQQMYETL